MVSSETSLSGKLFVEFVALIYLSYIKKQMQDNNLFKNYTLQQVLDKLDVIECFENPGDKLRGRRNAVQAEPAVSESRCQPANTLCRDLVIIARECRLTFAL